MDVTHFVLPPNVGADGAMATVGLSQDLFDSALLLLQKAGALNLDITGQLVRLGPAARACGTGMPCGPAWGGPAKAKLWVGQPKFCGYRVAVAKVQRRLWGGNRWSSLRSGCPKTCHDVGANFRSLRTTC